MKKLHISKTLSLPLDFVTSTQAILAKKGKGKTYKASVQAEELLDAHQQVVAIDPTGAWWGLRSSADGKSEGYPICIFGGEHADVPLESTAGEVIADAIASEHFSAVIDLTLFRKSESLRFMAAFLETLYRKNREALHLFIDEADVVAPQKTFGPDEARVLGATEDIVRRGRIRGIGCTLITQRPQVLNKNVLSQVDMLTALGMNHPKDIGAIKDWVAVHGDESQAKQMIADLPALPQGEAWVWAPAADIFKRVTFRDRRTFDSGRTPKAGERKVFPKVLANVDIERLGKTIAATVEEKKASDPKVLRARIAELEKQAARKVTPAARVETKTIEKPVIKDAQLTRIEKLLDKAGGQREGLLRTTELLDYATKDLRAVVHAAEIAKDPRVAPLRSPERAPERAPAKADTPPRVPRSAPRSPGNAGDVACTGALRRIMVALAQHPDGLADRKIGAFSGVSTKGGSYRTYLSRARGAGWIDDLRSGERRITPDGLAALGDFEPLPTGPELVDFWVRELGGAAGKILQVLVDAYPNAVDDESIGQAADVSTQGGSYRTYLSRLRSRDLLEDVGRGQRMASSTLFEVA